MTVGAGELVPGALQRPAGNALLRGGSRFVEFRDALVEEHQVVDGFWGHGHRFRGVKARLWQKHGGGTTVWLTMVAFTASVRTLLRIACVSVKAH